MQDNIFAYDIILGIFNPQGVHWTLMVCALYTMYLQHLQSQMYIYYSVYEPKGAHFGPLRSIDRKPG